MGFRLLVRGLHACFERPEFASDRVSYDVITPVHANMILTSIYWRSDIVWRVRRIRGLNPIRFESLSHRAGKILALSDVHYLLDAKFDMVANPLGNEAQHAKMFLRAARRRKPYRTPYLGQPRFLAAFQLLEEGDPEPQSAYAGQGEIDLGWIPVNQGGSAGAYRYFRACMIDGDILVPNEETETPLGEKPKIKPSE